MTTITQTEIDSILAYLAESRSEKKILTHFDMSGKRWRAVSRYLVAEGLIERRKSVGGLVYYKAR